MGQRVGYWSQGDNGNDTYFHCIGISQKMFEPPGPRTGIGQCFRGFPPSCSNWVGQSNSFMLKSFTLWNVVNYTTWMLPLGLSDIVQHRGSQPKGHLCFLRLLCLKQCKTDLEPGYGETKTILLRWPEELLKEGIYGLAEAALRDSWQSAGTVIKE